MFLQVLELHPEILQQILSTVLNTIMFEDCRNQWSMSRPLLGLILLNEEVSETSILNSVSWFCQVQCYDYLMSSQYFNQLRGNIVRSQPPDKQASMAQWFENLMDGIERNLLTKNRDRWESMAPFIYYILQFLLTDWACWVTGSLKTSLCSGGT